MSEHKEKEVIKEGGQHIVRAFDEELESLRAMTQRLGRVAAKHLERSVNAAINRDVRESQKVVDEDDLIDDLTRQIQELSFKVLSLRQPTSIDLREILCTQKISTYLERVGDYATNISKRAILLEKVPPIDPLPSIKRMSNLVKELLDGAMEAYVNQDGEKALVIWCGDERVDYVYAALLREILTYMMEDPRTISPCTHLLFMNRNLDRLGDHAANIAECVYFLARGEVPKGERPKPDTWGEIEPPAP